MKIFAALFVLCALATGIDSLIPSQVEIIQAWIIVWIGDGVNSQYISKQYTDTVELPVIDALVSAGDFNPNMEPVFSGTEIESIGGVAADPNNNYDYKFFVLNKLPKKTSPPTAANLSNNSPFDIFLGNKLYYLFWLRSDF